MRITFDTNINKNYNFAGRNLCRLLHPKVPQAGVAVFSRTRPLKFDAITSETLRKLSSIKYKPSNTGPKGSYSTFVFDNLTNKPQEVFVLPDTSGKNVNQSETYLFMIRDPIRGFLQTIGERSFEVNRKESIISPGAMYNHCKERYSGVGTRGHQLAVERKMQEGFENVEIHSYFSAYPFHKKCGFVPISDEIIPINNYLSELEDMAMSLKLDEETLMPLLERRLIGAKWYIDENLSLRNIAEYIYKKGITPPAAGGFSMQLSPLAMKEWEIFAESQPILLNK